MAVIQWFPGHMARGKRLIRDNLKKVDLVIDVLDARSPKASSNPLLYELTSSLPHVLVLNKEDLADPKATRAWQERWTGNKRLLPVCVSASNKRGVQAIERACLELCQDAPWRHRRPVRALIAGIPNVGKSTLINAMAGRRKVDSGAMPGLTRDLRRVPVSRNLEIFDTPGMLWHKFERPADGVVLAALGAIKETILPDETVLRNLLRYLQQVYPELLAQRYLLAPLPSDPQELLEAVARRRGCLLPGGRVDEPRICAAVLKDLRQGRIGRVSLQWPDGRGWKAELC